MSSISASAMTSGIVGVKISKEKLPDNFKVTNQAKNYFYGKLDGFFVVGCTDSPDFILSNTYIGPETWSTSVCYSIDVHTAFVRLCQFFGVSSSDTCIYVV